MPTQRKTAKSAKKTSAKSTKTSSRSSSRKSTTGRSGSKATKRGQSRGSQGRSGQSRGGKTATKRASSRRSSTPNGLELLTEDHREVQKMFRKAERMESGDARLQEIVETTCAALTLHAEIEEELFYPALREQDEDAIEEATVEHDVAKQLIAELQNMRGGDERYKATFKVLGEYVNHHVEEEEGQVFKLARRAKIDLAALGQAILERKQAAAGMTPEGGAGGSGTRGSSDTGAKRASGKRSSSRSSRGNTSRGQGGDQRSADTSDDMGAGDDAGYGTATGDAGDESAQPGRGGRTTH